MSVASMFFLGSWEEIPFHVVWLSVALAYGYRAWTAGRTALLVIVIMLVSAVAIGRAMTHGTAGLDELAEVPLMAGIFVAMAWHASRRQAAQEKLQRTTRERDFIRDASHQLRTPITVARGHAELILEADPRSPAAEDVMVIVGELQRLSTISDRLIVLAAADQPGFVDPAPIDVRVLVDDTITRWRPVARRRWQAFVAKPGTIVVDRERIECALDALIENAVNATEEGDLIRISAGVEDHVMWIEVMDEGCGISTDELPFIFDRFSHGVSSGQGYSGGTGLGLPVVKAIAEAHGGSVAVSSERQLGTTFRLRLNGGRG